MGESSGTPPPQGWRIDPVHVLGERERYGEPEFLLGHAPRIRAVPMLETREPGLLVSNELGDVRIYTDLLSDNPKEHDVWMRGDGGPDDLARLGNCGASFPDHYRYATALPHTGEAAWDLIVCEWLAGKMSIGRKIEEGDEFLFDWIRPMLSCRGIPESIEWRRDGVWDLLAGMEDGTIVRLPNRRDPQGFPFDETSEVVIDASFAAELGGPVTPCVVDWDGRGKSDLLVGTADGLVFLFRDVGGPDRVAFARGRRLVTPEGFLKVAGPASPTVVEVDGERWLLVADGSGAVWKWLIEQRQSYLTQDLYAAFGGETAGIRRDYERGSWWIRTDVAESLSGSLLCAAPEKPTVAPSLRSEPIVFDPAAPELQLKPPMPGVYEIHVGVYQPQDDVVTPTLEVRLSDEPAAELLTPGENLGGSDGSLHFKTADLTGREICFRQQVGAYQREGGVPVCIDFVRLVPVRPSRVERPERDLKVAAILDTFMWFWNVKTDTPEDMDSLIAKHRMAGFDLIYFKLGGGSWEYPSRVPGAENVVPDHPVFSDDDRRYAARLKEMLESVNRVELAAEACHRHDMKFFGWIRLQNHGEHIHGRFTLDRFYSEHPEYLEKNRWGESVEGKLCLGYPEVRRFHARIAEEAIELGADGILIETLRQLPKVLYGDPIVEEFRKRYGEDMRALSPFHPRVVDMQVEVMSTFLHEIREAIRRKKPEAELHVRVGKAHALMGCDPGRWARDGLVDAVLINHRAQEPREPDVPALVEVLRGTHCTPGATFARTYWGAEKAPLHPYRIDRQVAKYCNQGAGIIAFYETARVIPCPEFRRAIRRIGDPESMPSRVP